AWSATWLSTLLLSGRRAWRRPAPQAPPAPPPTGSRPGPWLRPTATARTPAPHSETGPPPTPHPTGRSRVERVAWPATAGRWSAGPRAYPRGCRDAGPRPGESSPPGHRGPRAPGTCPAGGSTPGRGPAADRATLLVEQAPPAQASRSPAFLAPAVGPPWLRARRGRPPHRASCRAAP